MSQYLFILGSHPALSIAEILNFHKKRDVLFANNEFCIVDLPDLKDPQRMLDELGGTIKVYEVDSLKSKVKSLKLGGSGQGTEARWDGESRSTNHEVRIKAENEGGEGGPGKEKSPLERGASALAGGGVFMEATKGENQTVSMENALFDLLGALRVTGKLSYAVNLYGKKDKNLQKGLILATKRFLKNRNVSCRFVNKDFQNTTSVQSFHEKLTSKGIEMGVFSHETGFVTGRLVASQNIESYTRRDYGRPERNMKIGLMPPKLAQILINLAGIEKGRSIYDPFCGTGGILTEAMLMGYEFYGSDINETAIFQAKRNVEDIIKRNKFPLHHLKRIFVQDALKLDKVSFPFDAVVTETYLGPVLSKEPTLEFFQATEHELDRMYEGFFQKLAKKIHVHTPILVCVPVFYIRGKPCYLKNVDSILKAAGFRTDPLFPASLEKVFKDAVTPRNSLVYHRAGQFVGREIMKLFKQ